MSYTPAKSVHKKPDAHRYMSAPPAALCCVDRGDRAKRNSPRRGSGTLALRAGLLLDHRLRWLSRGYRVGVSVYHLPGPIFWPKDHRNPQSKWGEILSSADLGLLPLYPHGVGELGGNVLRYLLEASDLAISDLRCSMLHSLGNMLPSTCGRAY